MLVSVIPPMPKPSIDVTGPSHVSTVRPFIGKYVRPELGEPSAGLTQLSNNSIECVASVPPHPQGLSTPSQEEMVELLKQVPYFTESETPVNNIKDHFMATRQVLIDLGNDPSISFVA